MSEPIQHYLMETGYVTNDDASYGVSYLEMREQGALVLSGNKSDLIFIAEYVLSDAMSREWSHTHMDDVSGFFINPGFELIVAKKPQAFFDEDEFMSEISRVPDDALYLKENRGVTASLVSGFARECQLLTDGIDAAPLAYLEFDYQQQYSCLTLSGNANGLLLFADRLVEAAVFEGDVTLNVTPEIVPVDNGVTLAIEKRDYTEVLLLKFGGLRPAPL